MFPSDLNSSLIQGMVCAELKCGTRQMWIFARNKIEQAGTILGWLVIERARTYQSSIVIDFAVVIFVGTIAVLCTKPKYKASKGFIRAANTSLVKICDAKLGVHITAEDGRV